MAAGAGARATRRHGAVALVSLLIALAVAELCARAVAPAWLRARMREIAVARSSTDWGSDASWPVERDAGLPVRFVPGGSFTVRDDEFVHAVAIDEYGGRASGRVSAGDQPILPVFGDSMTFGVGVRDEETWVGVAGRSLPVRLVNFGMPGSDLLDHLQALDRLEARLGSPAVCVFVVFLGNDLTSIASSMEPESRDNDARGPSLSDRLVAMNQTMQAHALLRRWYIVQWARALAVRAVNSSRRQPQVQGMLALMDRGARLESLRRAFEEAADRLVRASVRFRFSPAVIVIPDRYQVDERLRNDKAALYGVPPSSYDPRQPNHLVTDALSRRGIPFIDVSACLEGRVGQFYPRDGHLTAAGHAAIGDCVRAFLGDRWAARLR